MAGIKEAMQMIRESMEEGRDMILMEKGAREFGEYLIVPEMVIQSERTTYARWKDGSINSATCAPDDTFDPEIGYAMCLLKHAYRGKEGKVALAMIIAGRRFQEKKPRKLKKIKKGGKKK